MWALDCEESWVLKNWCFLTVVVEKTLESSLDCKIQPVHSEGDQPWDFLGRNDAKAETPVLWPPHAKSWLFGKDSDAGRNGGQEEKRTTEGEMTGWHHWLEGRESEWTPGDGDGQGGLACCDSWSRTRLSDWTELNTCVCMLSCFSHVWLFATLLMIVPARLLCPWGSPGKNTGVGCYVLLQRIFLTQGLNLHLLSLLLW